MDVRAEALAQLQRRSPQINAAGGGAPRRPTGQQPPAYEMLNRIGQQHADTPPNSHTVIPARYQYGGVATDENDNPPWPPRRGGTTGLEATAPDNMYQDGGVSAPSNDYPDPARPIYDAKMLARPPQYLSGYYGELGPTREQMAYQQAMRAMMPQMARPIYTPQMLARPPQKLSGYYGELADQEPAYQEGGVVDPKTGRVSRNYAREGGGSYYYVDPRAGRAQQPAATGETSLVNRQYPQGYDEFGPTLDTILGPDYTRMKNQMEAGRVPAGENPYGMQGGGVVYPGVQTDSAGLPTLSGTQAPQQQASPVAGEPSAKKQQPQRKARGLQPYEFGPADFYYSEPAMRKMTEQQAAPKGMEDGGVIPKQFMQYLAGGGVTKFTPDHHLMFALGMAHGLSTAQAQKGLDKVSRPNPMPP